MDRKAIVSSIRRYDNEGRATGARSRFADRIGIVAVSPRPGDQSSQRALGQPGRQAAGSGQREGIEGDTDTTTDC